jgi:hypothetical protein
MGDTTALLLCLELIFDVVYHLKYHVPTFTLHASFPTVCSFVGTRCWTHCCGCGIIVIVSQVAIVNALRETTKGEIGNNGGGGGKFQEGRGGDVGAIGERGGVEWRTLHCTVRRHTWLQLLRKGCCR